MSTSLKKFRFALIVALLLGVFGTKGLSQDNVSHSDCAYWKSNIIHDSKRDYEKKDDPLKRQDILKGMECLLSFKGNKELSMVSSVTSLTSSQSFGFVPADVAALYYISYLILSVGIMEMVWLCSMQKVYGTTLAR